MLVQQTITPKAPSGKLYVPCGYVSALHADPIEKMPFFHALPGTSALSIGMLGCDLHCGYCQNWVTCVATKENMRICRCRQPEPRYAVIFGANRT